MKRCFEFIATVVFITSSILAANTNNVSSVAGKHPLPVSGGGENRKMKLIYLSGIILVLLAGCYDRYSGPYLVNQYDYDIMVEYGVADFFPDATRKFSVASHHYVSTGHEGTGPQLYWIKVYLEKDAKTYSKEKLDDMRKGAGVMSPSKEVWVFSSEGLHLENRDHLSYSQWASYRK